MEINQPQSLFETPLFLMKSVGEDFDNPDYLPRFGGIASSENTDVDGDSILRKMLDVSYIAKRGYVNWDHSRLPSDQLGYVTKAEVIGHNDVAKYEDLLQVSLHKSASLFVQGVFYKHSDKAMDVMKMLKSIPVGQDGAVGMSVEGGVLRSKDGVVKAIVRGVAITPAPAHPDTLCRMMKSLSLDVSNSVGSTAIEEAMLKGMRENDAVLRVMELRPQYDLPLARKLVRYIFSKIQSGGN